MNEEALQTFLDQLFAKLTAQFAASNRRWIPVDDAAAYISVSTKTLNRLISEGRIKASHPTGGSTRIDRQQLDAYMVASQRRKGTRGRIAAG